jgi:hypothetical protein
MTLILLEALGAGLLLVFIVWWTMFSGRRGGEPEALEEADEADEAGEGDEAHEPDASRGQARGQEAAGRRDAGVEPPPR